MRLGFLTSVTSCPLGHATRAYISARRRRRRVHLALRAPRASLPANDAPTVRGAQEPFAHDALSRFAADCRAAHMLLERAEVAPGMGAGARAAAEGVDMTALAGAYGHVLARDIRALRTKVDTAAVAKALIAACGADAGNPPMSLQQFEMWLRAAQRTEGKDTDAGIGGDNKQMSAMYGHMLGRALSAAALELDPALVAAGVVDAAEGKFPMSEAEYDRQFETLQSYATAAQASAWERSADTFFKWLREQDDVADLENDGFVLGVPGATIGKGAPAGKGSDVMPEVEVVLHGRFLDGRSFVVPTYSDGLDHPADTVRVPLENVPSAFRSGLCGMRVGETRTLFLHPYAAVEVLEIFGGPEKFPPNVSLVFDFYLCSIRNASALGLKSSNFIH